MRSVSFKGETLRFSSFPIVRCPVVHFNRQREATENAQPNQDDHLRSRRSPSVSSNGSQQRVEHTATGYSRDGTQQLVNLLLAFPSVERILFNDSEIVGVSSSNGHNNHLDVRVRSGCGN